MCCIGLNPYDLTGRRFVGLKRRGAHMHTVLYCALCQGPLVHSADANRIFAAGLRPTVAAWTKKNQTPKTETDTVAGPATSFTASATLTSTRTTSNRSRSRCASKGLPLHVARHCFGPFLLLFGLPVRTPSGALARPCGFKKLYGNKLEKLADRADSDSIPDPQHQAQDHQVSEPSLTNLMIMPHSEHVPVSWGVLSQK